MTSYLEDPPPEMTEREILKARRIASGKAMIKAFEDLGAPEEILDYQRLLNRTFAGIRDRDQGISFGDAYERAEAEVRSKIDQDAYRKASERWAAALRSGR